MNTIDNKNEVLIKIFETLVEILGKKNASDLFLFIKKHSSQDGIENFYVCEIIKLNYRKKMTIADEITPKLYKIKEEYKNVLVRIFKTFNINLGEL